MARQKKDQTAERPKTSKRRSASQTHLRNQRVTEDDKDSVSDKASELAKNIWLAGVGAYGKAIQDAQGRLEKAMEPPKLFRDLVKAGTLLEEDARQALETTVNARQSVEDRIQRVRENFQLQRPAKLEELSALQAQVNNLSHQVAQLGEQVAHLTDQQTATKPKRKAATKTKAKRKAATKTRAKTTTKAAKSTRNTV